MGDAFSMIAMAYDTPSIPLYEFMIQGWPVIEPAHSLIPNWHIGAIAEYLTAVQLQQIKKLVINMPPRHGKSNLVTVLFPAWLWSMRPWWRGLFISYAQSLSNKHSKNRRDIIKSDWYQQRWGGLVQLSHDQNQKMEFENTARGHMIATSIGGSVTGKGGDGIIIDDGINPKEAESEADRKFALEEVGRTVSTRLDDKKNGFIIEVAQRTHHDDISAKLLAEGYTHLSLPAENRTRVTIVLPISKQEIVREPGDLLWPEREDAVVLAAQKTAMGTRSYSAQYLQDPANNESAMVDRSWWKFYKEDPTVLIQRCEIAGQSWDFAFKDLEEGSFVCGLIGARIGADCYILQEYRDHWNFPKTISAIKRAMFEWPKAVAKWYEDRANGPAIKAQAQRDIPGLIPVEPIGSKAARMAAASPHIEAGNVWLPYPYDAEMRIVPRFAWVLDFIEEVAHFPKEPNDRGDTLSQLILKLMNINILTEDFVEEGAMLEGMSQAPDFDSNEVNPNEEYD